MLVFERHEYYGEGSTRVPAAKLPRWVREYLGRMKEMYDVQWNNYARRIRSRGRSYFLVGGTGPAGEEVWFEFGNEPVRVRYVLVDEAGFSPEELGLGGPSIHELTEALVHELEGEALRALKARDKELVAFEGLDDSLVRGRLESVAESLTGRPFEEEEKARFQEEARKRAEEILGERGKRMPFLKRERGDKEEV